ncbi:unnamed protein product [Protopolystoma xenopodis]|uniref:Uncharacterized protein n=1 Tax=Protopolystoma xenopodis TaxID=117903 RepID=A0A3S5BVD9_9PLAT|nr:unnamed protein product [Protopolystoma xenopodis]
MEAGGAHSRRTSLALTEAALRLVTCEGTEGEENAIGGGGSQSWALSCLRNEAPRVLESALLARRCGRNDAQHECLKQGPIPSELVARRPVDREHDLLHPTTPDDKSS